MRKKVEDKLLEKRILRLFNKRVTPLKFGEIVDKLNQNKKIKRSPPVVKRHINYLISDRKIIQDKLGFKVIGKQYKDIISRCILCNKEKVTKKAICASCAIKKRKGLI
jgi:hypothetical protein